MQGTVPFFPDSVFCCPPTHSAHAYMPVISLSFLLAINLFLFFLIPIYPGHVVYFLLSTNISFRIIALFYLYLVHMQSDASTTNSTYPHIPSTQTHSMSHEGTSKTVTASEAALAAGIPEQHHITVIPKSTPKKKTKAGAPVRKRLSLACTTCRQRKVKCDGARPSCRTCAKFNWPCVYQPSNRKRGPRPRALNMMDSPMSYGSHQPPYWQPPSTPGQYPPPPYCGPHGPFGSYGPYGSYNGGRPMMSPSSHMVPPPPPLPPPPLASYSHQNPSMTMAMRMPPFGSLPPHGLSPNGNPLQADPAHHRLGDYNYDSYSTYGDFIASSGAIRIRPPSSSSAHNQPYPPSVPGPAPSGATKNKEHHPPPGTGLSSSSISSLIPDHHCKPPEDIPVRKLLGGLGEVTVIQERQPPPPLAPTTPMLEPDSAPQPTISNQSRSGQSSAQSMQHSGKTAAIHTSPPPPEIYARRKADTANFQTQTKQEHCPDSGVGTLSLLSSPPPTATEATTDNVLEGQAFDRRHGKMPLSAPIPSSSSFPSSAVTATKDQQDALSFESQQLPFTDNSVRPRLPPLSEILGDDYHKQQTSRTTTTAISLLDKHSQQQQSLHKDSFRDELSKMIAHGH